jgi:hypothetical protein
LNPSLFKSTAIDIIRAGKQKASELQAAKLAYDIYTEHGSSISELVKLHKKYH